jgi:hypothetical protein
MPVQVFGYAKVTLRTPMNIIKRNYASELCWEQTPKRYCQKCPGFDIFTLRRNLRRNFFVAALAT